MLDDAARVREEQFAAACELAAGGADAAEARDRFAPTLAGSRADRAAAAYAVGWLDPELLDQAETAGDALLQAAQLLGLVRRLNDVLAAALFDDPRLDVPVHQMLGARLADSVSLATALLAAVDNLAELDDSALAHGVQALACEAALEACGWALSATPAADVRARVERRRTWLLATYPGTRVLELLDDVAGAMAGRS